MATPPASTKASLDQRLSARARERWPALRGVQVRFRGPFAYLAGELTDGETLPLCRLRYAGSASTWGCRRSWNFRSLDHRNSLGGGSPAVVVEVSV